MLVAPKEPFSHPFPPDPPDASTFEAPSVRLLPTILIDPPAPPPPPPAYSPAPSQLVPELVGLPLAALLEIVPLNVTEWAAIYTIPPLAPPAPAVGPVLL